MGVIHDGQLAGLDEAISHKDKKAAAALLGPIRGVGRRVVENAWALLMG